MSDKTPEKVKNTEIWEFKTAEELAIALEKKSKTDLAKKIREISWEVQDNSIDLRQKLQKELNENEQKEIRETLKDSWVARVFTKWMTTEEKAIQEAKNNAWEMLWEENAKTLQKVEWIWNRLSTWFDKIWDIFSEKWIMAWIWAIILMFKWIFSWDFSALDNILNPNMSKSDVDEAGKKVWDKLSGKVDIKYQYSSSAVSYIFWGEEKNTLNKLFALDKFQNMKYEEVKKIYEKYKNSVNKNWLEKELWIEWVKWNDVFKALWVLVNENEKSWKLLSDFYSKKWENLWNKTIKESISWLYTNIKMFKSLENITTPDQIIDAWKNFALKIEQLPNGESEIKWEIYDSLKELWITKNIILFINSRWKNGFEDIIQLEKNLDWIQSELSTEDKKELTEKFIPFAKNIENTLWDQFWHKYGDSIKECFASKHLSPTELLELYAITWWSYNHESLNDMQKTYIYTKLISLIDDRDHKLAWAYWTLIVKKWDTPLPPWVLSMLSYLWWKLASWAEKIWENLYWAAKENPALAWIIALTIYFGPWFSSKESAHNKVKRIFK